MEKDNTYRKLEKDFAAIRDERGTQANTANRIGSAFLSLLSYIGNAAFLRKDVPDTAEQVMTFLKGIVAKAVSYFQGIVNRGDINNNGDITNTGNIHNTGDITNSGNIMTNNLTVTGKATFFELEIQKAKAAGGMSVNSAGTFHIDAVEETADGFVCYQRAEKDGVTLLQTCEVKDQMMCSNGMNILKGGKGNHYYWRLATEAPKEVVMHTIDGKEEKCLKLVLSKTDRQKREGESPQDIGDIPKVGDDLVQIGNRDNKERQSVMMSCAYNSFDPELKPSYWAHYMGVNDYDISKHRYTWFAANGSNVTGNFKVQSDNGELESIEDYVRGLATNTVVYKMSISPSLYYINADGTAAAQVVNISAYKIQGDKMTQLQDSDKVQVYVSLGVFEKSDHGSLTGSGGSWRYFPNAEDGMEERILELYVGGKMVDRQVVNAVKDGEKGKDAITYKLIPMSENVLAYFTEVDENNSENTEKAGEKKKKTKMVDVRLAYKLQKAVGEQVTFTTLTAEGMTLTVQPSVGKSVSFEYKSGMYQLSASITYNEIPDNSYIVTLKKGSDIVDQRIVPITFKPKVVFDIDTKNGEIRSDITNIKGDMNSFKATIKETSSTVGNLKKKFTQFKQTSNEISLTVNNGTRPNLLWGSELDLSEVQDKIQLAYDNGNIIKQETAKKEDLQRQLDATATNDTAKRNDLQTKINACNKDINTARNKVSECKVAIQKHLGVELGEIKVDDAEYFQYLKGGGVAGSDAVMFKSKDGVARWTNIKWEKIKVKPNTVYTMSAWVKFTPNKKNVNKIYVAVNETASSKDLAFMEGSDIQYYLGEIKDWERRHWTFTTKNETLITVVFAHSGTDESLMWLCRPKLEEGNAATPWCEYDGTVEALIASGFSLKDKKMTFTSDNFIIRNNNGDVTVTVDRNGMMQFYGKDKIYPGIRFGVNEQGEMVLEFWRGNKMMYDLGPDNVFQKLDRVESYFEESDLESVVVYTSYGEEFIRRDYGANVYILREGYKMIGNVRQYDVSVGQHPSAYDGKIFTKKVSPINSFTMLKLPNVTGTYVHMFDAMAIDNMEKASKAGQITELRNIQVINVWDGVCLPRNVVIEGDGGRVKIHSNSYKMPDELSTLNFEH
ncbi:hypothetical protein [Hoylesella buccalis]|uniref:hypothetical protein n=1 Tax=Hoylesella buccalis TaxID=28127 RepID=UPI0006896A77|nr:hypothetical protein [Hoylesella buccalis]